MVSRYDEIALMFKEVRDEIARRAKNLADRKDAEIYVTPASQIVSQHTTEAS